MCDLYLELAEKVHCGQEGGYLVWAHELLSQIYMLLIWMCVLPVNKQWKGVHGQG